MQQASIPDPEVVREAFQEVLAGPDFQYAGTSPIARAFRAVVEWVQDLFHRWFPAGVGDPNCGSPSVCARFHHPLPPPPLSGPQPGPSERDRVGGARAGATRRGGLAGVGAR